MLKTYNYFIIFTIFINFILIVILNKPQIFPDSYYYFDEGKNLFEKNYTVNSFKILYSAWIFVNFLSYKLLEENWYYGIITLNLFSSFFIIYASIKLINLSNINNILLFILIQIFCLDLWIYNSYILSDLLFTLFAFTIFVFMYKYFKNEKNIYILLSVILSLLLSLIKPTVFPIIGFVLFAFLTKKRIFTRLNIIIYVLIFFLIIVFVSSIQIIFINLNFVSEIEIIKSYFYWLKLQFQQGIIIYDRPEYYLGQINNLFSVIKYNFYKIIMYYNFIPSGYSNTHKFINLIYLFLIITTIIKYRAIDKKKFDRESIYLICLYIFSFGFFHMITIIDYDWRYRLPILPILSLLPFLIFEDKKFYA